MQVEQIPIELLKTDGDNPNLMSQEQEKALLESITKFGFVVPVIIDKDNVIADGEHRFQALRKTGATTVPCVRLENLSEADRKLLRQIMNKLKGTHDWELDIEEIKRIMETMNKDDVLKYLSEDSELLQEVQQMMNPRNDEDFNVEESLNREPKYKVELGQVWVLGKHRLMCGDSTSEEEVNKLLCGDKASMAFSDPPYGMKKENEGILNDNLNQDKLLEFNKKWIPNSFNHLKKNSSWYCWGTDESLMDCYSIILKPLIKNNEITFRNLITWSKGKADYFGRSF